MSINSYEVKGVTFYKVRWFARSNINPSNRASFYKSGIASEEEARAIENRFRKEGVVELYRKDLLGVSWGELVDKWYQHRLTNEVNDEDVRLGLSTLDDYLGTLEKWTGHLRRKPAGDINSSEIKKIFESTKEKIVTRAHRRRIKRLIDEVFNFGIETQLLRNIARSPTFEISLGQKRNVRPEILTVKEATRLIELAMQERHPWRYVWAFSYLSLMRSQEQYALPWSAIDRVNRVILVNQSYSIKAKRKGLNPIRCTKTGDWHYVPINADLETILDELSKETAGSEYVFPRNKTWETNKQAAILRKFCLKHGLPSICHHTLRACGATHLIQMGLEPANVMKVGGWRSLKSMTHYIRMAGIEVKGLTDNLFILPKANLGMGILPFTSSVR